jgi:glycosyltransferase involved in cell wall biosynthesis
MNQTSLPFVSICTPTFNRRPFIPFIIECFKQQTYPSHLLEWIIIDDGTDAIGDLVKTIPQVKYYYYKCDENMNLGKKRNLMHEKCSGDILIYMDDDDYYPPTRVEHAVKTLLENPQYLIAGSSEMHIYFDSQKKVYQCGPYKDTHATAATFAFRKELLLQTSYREESKFSEENHFTKGYTIPLIQLNSINTIMVFSHKHNSLNKEKLLDNPKSTKTYPSRYSVDDFIKDPILKQFYMYDMNKLLENYQPGRPENKPKLIEEVSHIDKVREVKQKAINRINANQNEINENQNKIETGDVVFNKIKQIKDEYEKKLMDKNLLIDQLMKKVKQLTIQLEEKKL